MTKNIILVGVGGQGTILASKLLSEGLSVAMDICGGLCMSSRQAFIL